MWVELIAGTWLLGEYAYNAWESRDKKSGPGNPAYDLGLPQTEDGVPVPVVYGRCRVRRPILAWLGTPRYYNISGVASYLGTSDDIYGESGVFGGSSLPDDFSVVYAANQLYVLGIGTDSQINGIHAVWAGEQKLVDGSVGANWPAKYSDIDHLTTLSNLQGSGGPAYAGDQHHVGESNFRQALVLSPNWPKTPPEITGGLIEFLSGHSNQQLVDYTKTAPDPTGALTQAGGRMIVGGFGLSGTVPSYEQIPGYRNYLSAFLYGMSTIPWLIGSSPQIPAYSFEVSSYPNSTFATGINSTIQVGNVYDMNPVDAAYDLITTYFGKMGYLNAPIDNASWTAAANTLWNEGNGYSRAIEEGQTAGDVLLEISKQMDGVIYECLDGTIKIKLIRGDYDPTALFRIDETNCIDLEDVAFGSWQDVATRIVLKFKNRNKEYNDDTVVVQAQANAVGLDNQVLETQLEYPGVCDPVNALAIANRELQVRTRPLAKCRAIMDRAAYRLEPGQPVMVNFPKYNVVNMVFRVAKAPRGTLLDGKMSYDLIQDPYYVWRNRVVGRPVVVDVNTNLGKTVRGGRF